MTAPARLLLAIAAATAFVVVPERLATDGGADALRIALMLALVVLAARRRGDAGGAARAACIALGALPVLLLAAGVAAKMAVSWWSAGGAAVPGLDGARAAALAGSLAALTGQGELMAAACCGAWVFVMLGGRTAASAR